MTGCEPLGKWTHQAFKTKVFVKSERGHVVGGLTPGELTNSELVGAVEEVEN